MSERAPFSVLLSTYGGDDAAELDSALASVFDQSVRPDELLVVVDPTTGSPVRDVLDAYEGRYPKRVELRELAEPRGLGGALRVGVRRCRNELVARMDTDDISVPERFETQLAFFERNPDVDVVGGYVAEFADDPADVLSVREVPTDPAAVERSARFRCPLNHPTVMFRKPAVLAAGNYREWRGLEDYDLWMRVLSDGGTIANVPEVLLKMRAGDDLYDRRGGAGYLRSEIALFAEFYDRGYLSLPELLVNVCVRVPLRLSPSRLRRAVYERRLRSS